MHSRALGYDRTVPICFSLPHESTYVRQFRRVSHVFHFPMPKQIVGQLSFEEHITYLSATSITGTSHVFSQDHTIRAQQHRTHIVF